MKQRLVKRYTFIYIYYPMAVLMLLLSSCIRDKRTDCPPEKIRIYFSYLTATYGQEVIDPADVNRINLFVFDRNGKFLGEWIDENPQLSPSYYMELPLDYGTYQFVCWAGISPGYTIEPYPLGRGEVHFDDCRLSLERTRQSTIEETPHPLFHAMLEKGVIDKPEANFTLELKQLTNTINLTVTGIPVTTDDYRLSIEDNNGDYKFDSSLASPDNEKLHYITSCSKDGQGQPYASLRILTLSEERPTPVLTFSNTTTGEILFSANLVGWIVKLREQGVTVDFNTIHTYEIHLKFTQTDMKIFINGWEITNSKHEL